MSKTATHEIVPVLSMAFGMTICSVCVRFVLRRPDGTFTHVEETK